MWTALMDRIPVWSDIAVLFGLNLLVQSTIVILIGLAGAHLMRQRRRGAAAQSLLLRFCLIGVLCTPPALLVFSVQGWKGLHLSIPLRHSSVAQTRFAPVSPEVSPAPGAVQPGVSANRMESATVSRNSGPVSDTPSPARPPLAGSAEPHRSPESAVGTSGSPAPAVRKNIVPNAVIHRIVSIFTILLSLAWAACALFLALRTAAISLYIRRIRRLSSPALPRYLALCGEAARELRITAPPVLQSSYVTSTLLTGLIRPVILLPRGGSEDAMATREVFLHELAHLARRDPLWLHLGQFAKILIPFQPLLWVLVHRIEEMSDYACDDYVIRHTGSARPYANQLFNLARAFQPGGIEAKAGSGILSERFPLLRRIERILDNSYSRHITVSANEVMSFTILFLCAVTLTGFIGFRGENGTKTAYAAEQGTNRLSKPISRFHTPLPVVLGVANTLREQVTASLRNSGMESSPDPVGQTPRGETREQRIDASIRDDARESFPVIASLTPEEIPSDIVPAGSESIAGITSVSPESPSLRTEPVPDSPDTTASTKNEPSETTARSVAARDSLLFANRLELRQAATVRGESAAPNAGKVEIAVPDAREGKLRESIAQGQENPVWSPAGGAIAFTGANGVGIWSVPASGGKPTLLLDNSDDCTPQGNVSPRGASRILGFTPDGTEITYVRYIPNASAAGAKKEAPTGGVSFTPIIESIRLHTNERREIIRNASAGLWSTDGRYFVYVGDACYGISVLDTTTGTSRVLIGTGKSPCITPDGLSIIYVDWGGGFSDQLFRIPITGGKPEQLTADGYWWNPKCSPDGEWVLCSCGNMGAFARLRAYNTKTRNTYEVFFDNAQSAEMGDWSPSGRQFCYTLSGGEYSHGVNVRKSAIYIDNFGLSGGSGQETAVSVKPAAFKLIGNYPNPFNPSTTITFSLPSEGTAELVIYNMAGQKVRDLVSGKLSAGEHAVVWNGRDQQGNPVSSGVYISRLKMEGKVETRRMTLVK